jgi:hypothetical protein
VQRPTTCWEQYMLTTNEYGRNLSRRYAQSITETGIRDRGLRTGAGGVAMTAAP